MAGRVYIYTEGKQYRTTLFASSAEKLLEDLKLAFLKESTGIVGVFELEDKSNLVLGPEAMSRAHFILKDESM